MQYAIVSDIHANLQAWNAVLLDIRSQQIDRIVCLGDIVGYGPNPAEVLSSVHSEVDYLVMGNHDAVICGKMDTSLFNDVAKEIIEWTKQVLNPAAIQFLGDLPLSIKAPEFRCTHGDFSHPSAFNYLLEPSDALDSWSHVSEDLLFVGHTHRRGMYVLGASGTPHWLETQDFEIEEGKRYIVDVGSVGQPRDGDTRSSYVILNTETRSVYWRRIPFDIDGYAASVTAASIPSEGSYFLADDPRSSSQPIRELLDFSPATSEDQAACGVTEIAEVVHLRKHVQQWKVLAFAVLLASVVALGLVSIATWRHVHRGRYISNIPLDSIYAASEPSLSHVSWTLHLGDARKQSFTFSGQNEKTLTLSSHTTADTVRMQSAPVRARKGDKFCIEGLLKKESDFSGGIALVVSLAKETGETIDQYVVKEPNQQRKDGWLLGKQTFEVPSGVESLSFQVRAEFTGRVTIKKLFLDRKDIKGTSSLR